MWNGIVSARLLLKAPTNFFGPSLILSIAAWAGASTAVLTLLWYGLPILNFVFEPFPFFDNLPPKSAFKSAFFFLLPTGGDSLAEFVDLEASPKVPICFYFALVLMFVHLLPVLASL